MNAAIRLAILVAALSIAAGPAWDQSPAQAVEGPTAEPPPSLSPDVMALITPVREAIDRAQAEQARLAPAADDRETLRRLGEMDQLVWKSLAKVDFARIPADQKLAAKDLLGSWIQPVDQADQSTLLKILPPEGWFAISRYGADGEAAAYRVVLHSGLDYWRRFTPVVERFATIGEADGAHYALLYDRLAVHQGLPQRFGSQLTCQAGRYKPYPIEDPVHLDQRRQKWGMPVQAVFMKTVSGLSC